jgi:hypothetical protein
LVVLTHGGTWPAGRDLHAGAGGIEPAIVIGAADLTLDALTDRQIGA